MEARILEAADSPSELETLFRSNPDEFLRAFPAVLAQRPESTVLQVWKARFDYGTDPRKNATSQAWSRKTILTVLLLTALAGTIFELPNYFPSIDTSWFFSREPALIFIVPLIAYFLLRDRSIKFAVLVGLVTACALLYLNLLPSRGSDTYEFAKTYGAFDDALANAETHIPLFLWLVTGVAFAGSAWRRADARMGFLRYNGELVIYATILLLGAAVLFFLTLNLLNFIETSYEFSLWYVKYVAVYGVASIPIIGTLLVTGVIDKRLNIAPTIARIFTPLFLVTITVYLVIMVAYRSNPFGDREYLVALNVLLIVVLGLLIFTIAERNAGVPAGTNDYVNMGLALATTILDAIALSVTILRLTGDAYGLTPNRVTIIGINLLILVHLIGILIHYARFTWGRRPFARVESWIAGYLPVYAIWAIMVSVSLPILYWYK